jgi:quinolinate synthase
MMALDTMPPPTVSSVENRREALLQDIAELKRQHNAVILAHLYERLEVQDVADYRGDSLGLSQQAANTLADTIIFCGVHFMAETAKLLSPEKTVILANAHAGCPMADMITPKQLQGFKDQYPGVPVVGYVNTSAAVKALCDVCCTSANAVEVVKHLGVDRVLFVPDRHLGEHVAKQLPEVEVICWQGFCPVHLRIELADLMALKAAHPQALVLVHPECDEPVKAQADFIGSTTALVEQAYACTQAKAFIICTEEGVVARLAQELPHKQFFAPSRVQATCPNMKMTRLENIKSALMGLNAPIEIEPSVFEPARRAIDRMMAVPVAQTPKTGGGSAACRCSSKA